MESTRCSLPIATSDCYELTTLFNVIRLHCLYLLASPCTQMVKAIKFVSDLHNFDHSCHVIGHLTIAKTFPVLVLVLVLVL